MAPTESITWLYYTVLSVLNCKELLDLIDPSYFNLPLRLFSITNANVKSHRESITMIIIQLKLLFALIDNKNNRFT